MAPGAPIEMVNASRNGSSSINGYEPVDGFNVVKQRKNRVQVNGSTASSSEDDGTDSELGFDVEIAGHHAMSKRTFDKFLPRKRSFGASNRSLTMHLSPLLAGPVEMEADGALVGNGKSHRAYLTCSHE